MMILIIFIGILLVIAVDDDDSHGDPCDGGL